MFKNIKNPPHLLLHTALINGYSGPTRHSSLHRCGLLLAAETSVKQKFMGRLVNNLENSTAQCSFLHKESCAFLCFWMLHGIYIRTQVYAFLSWLVFLCVCVWEREHANWPRRDTLRWWMPATALLMLSHKGRLWCPETVLQISDS